MSKTDAADAASAAHSAAQAKGPATLVVAGVLALALGGLGVAAFTMSKQNTPMAAKGAVDADAAAKAAKATAGGVPSQATITVKPQEDAPLPGASGSAHAAEGAPDSTSAFPQEDPSLK